jgi:hypothetical protein
MLATMEKTGWGDPGGTRRVCLSHCPPAAGLIWVRYPVIDLCPGEPLLTQVGRGCPSSPFVRGIPGHKGHIGRKGQAGGQAGHVLSRPLVLQLQCAPSLSLSPFQAAQDSQNVTYAQLALRQGTTALPSSQSEEPSWDQWAHCSGVHQPLKTLTPYSRESPQWTQDLPWWTLMMSPHRGQLTWHQKPLGTCGSHLIRHQR